MGYETKAVWKCIDQFLIKSPRQLMTTHCGQLESRCVLRRIVIDIDLDRIKRSRDGQDSIVDSRFAVGQKLVSASSIDLL